MEAQKKHLIFIASVYFASKKMISSAKKEKKKRTDEQIAELKL